MEKQTRVHFDSNIRVDDECRVAVRVDCYSIPEDLRRRIETQADVCLASIAEILKELPSVMADQLKKGSLPDEREVKPQDREQVAEVSCDEKTEWEKEKCLYLGEFPSSRQYKFTTPGKAKSRMIMNHMALNKTILHHLSINEPFRLTIEYEPEELNSKFKIESDHECPDKLNI